MVFKQDLSVVTTGNDEFVVNGIIYIYFESRNIRMSPNILTAIFMLPFDDTLEAATWRMLDSLYTRVNDMLFTLLNINTASVGSNELALPTEPTKPPAFRWLKKLFEKSTRVTTDAVLHWTPVSKFIKKASTLFGFFSWHRARDDDYIKLEWWRIFPRPSKRAFLWHNFLPFSFFLLSSFACSLFGNVSP